MDTGFSLNIYVYSELQIFFNLNGFPMQQVYLTMHGHDIWNELQWSFSNYIILNEVTDVTGTI